MISQALAALSLLSLLLTTGHGFSLAALLRARPQGMSSSFNEMTPQASLVGNQVITIAENCWLAHSVNDVITSGEMADGERAQQSLSEPVGDITADFSLCATLADDKTLSIALQATSSSFTVNTEQVALLSRVMVQWFLNQQVHDVKTVELPYAKAIDMSTCSSADDRATRLFDTSSSKEEIEWSEMVTQDGVALGQLPRDMVHQHNVLHRGIGVLVTDQSSDKVYVHRRTDSKRIFPGLYDMFIGGVSTAGEPSLQTAIRELSEELELERVLQEPSRVMSAARFQTLVCTAYNRCYVTVFECSIDKDQDAITWQPEEVAWGDFIPLATVEASADLSVDRLVASEQWPGKVPSDLKERVQKSSNYRATRNWQSWDYVPDGLLVWEAWLEYKMQPAVSE